MLPARLPPLHFALGLALAACSGSIGGDADSGDDPDAVDADLNLPELRDDGLPPGSYRELAALSIDHAALAEGFEQGGYSLPAGAIVYAAKLDRGVGSPVLQAFDAGGGAFSTDFWPASTIKVISALGALDALGELGFTGEADVSYAGVGSLGTLRSIYDPAIRVSDNLAYVRTLQIAGVERINSVFLSAENGFSDTVLTRSYVAGVPANSTPAITLREGDKEATIPARTDPTDFGCVGNCTNLFELIEGARRLLLDAEIPETERYTIAATDKDALVAAMCGAESFIEAGAERVLGPVTVCNKPGWVPDYEYLDHGLIEVEATGERYLLAISLPWSQCGSHGACTAMIGDIAEAALVALQPREAPPIFSDGGASLPIEREGLRLQATAAGATRLELWLGGEKLAPVLGDSYFDWQLPRDPGSELLRLRAYNGDTPVAQRIVHLATSTSD